MILIAFLLRVYRIGEQELWLDEASSFQIATTQSWFGSLLTDNNPPLYYLLLRAWMRSLDRAKRPFAYCRPGFGTLVMVAILTG